jgi:hypothetical protein
MNILNSLSLWRNQTKNKLPIKDDKFSELDRSDYDCLIDDELGLDMEANRPYHDYGYHRHYQEHIRDKQNITSNNLGATFIKHERYQDYECYGSE